MLSMGVYASKYTCFFFLNVSGTPTGTQQRKTAVTERFLDDSSMRLPMKQRIGNVTTTDADVP